MKLPRSAYPLIAIALVLLAFNLVFVWYSPKDIVSFVGVSNSYVAVFLIASFGGLSSFTSSILYGSIATFAAGGAMPWLLGITAGIGIGVGDSIIYNLIQYGYKEVRGDWKERVEGQRVFLEHVPLWLQYVAIFLLLGATPLPNDLLMIALVVLGFRYKRVWPLLFLGGISIATITAYAGDQWLSTLWS